MASEEKGKYQPWSHEEFMADRKVRRMTSVELKTYMLMLHEAFVCETRPNLPDNEEELEEMALCTDHEEWMSVREAVLGMFDKATVSGIPVLTRKRLTDDWKKLQEIREARSEAGKASAAKRKSTSVEHSSTNVNTCAQVSKEVSKEVKEEREEKEESNPDSLSFENDGQGDEMKTDRQIDAMTQHFFGKKAFLRGRNGDDLKSLILQHKGSSVERAYKAFCEENQDNPDISDPVAVFLEAADDLLGAESPLRASAKDPEVVSLVRELSYLSGGQISFVDKQRRRLAEVLKEFSAEEIQSAFKVWMGDQDLTDTKNLSFLPGKFVQIVDGLCYSAKKRKQESEQAQTLRDQTAKRLQEEAEAERAESEKKRLAESEVFDPFTESI